MESRRQTRARPQRNNEQESPRAPAIKKRNVAARASPVRRSSRPRSAVFGSAPTVTSPVDIPSPVKESPESTKSSNKGNNLPTTLTTNTSSRAPIKSQTTASVHSSYSSNTQETLDIRPNSSETVKLNDYIRRSQSQTNRSVGDSTHTPVTELESRYSRSISRSQYDEDNISKAEFSDNDGNDDYLDECDEDYKSFHEPTSQRGKNAYSLCRKPNAPREFGGWLGAIALMVLAPCFIYYLQWTCGKGRCVLKTLDIKAIAAALTDFNYLNMKVFPFKIVGAYWGYNWCIILLSALGLFGRHVRLINNSDPFASGGRAIEYTFNVFPMAVLLTLGIAVAEYINYPLVDFVLLHYKHFCLYGFINAFLLALWCYVKTNLLPERPLHVNVQANEYGQSGNKIIDYALGRQINPKAFGIMDLKLIYYRISLLTTLLFAECFIYKNVKLPVMLIEEVGIINNVLFYWSNTTYDQVALLSAVLLLIYITDAIVFEHHLASSFELQSEGFGCLLLLRYAATPFVLSAVAKYFLEHRTPLACAYVVHVSIAVLLIGLALKRLSCAIKYRYRLDPYNARFKNLETLATHQGKRLILGKLWGRLRQPNYAGDIIALLALGIPLFLRFAWPPIIGLLLCVLLLLHRATRANTRNIERYQSSWVRYCARVRNYVLPKVF